MHIRTRNDLIGWLENNAPRRAIARAMQEGQVEVYGGFKRIPCTPCRDGWIVRVTSKFDFTWIVAIKPQLWEGYRAYILLDDVPWEFWIGDESENKLYRGDKPLQYKELRDARETKK